MNQRPRIKIELSATDKIIELIGWFALATIWAMVITSYSNLPDTIPTHYNAVGEIDGFGKKMNILTLPLLSTLFFVGITILNRFPHIFTYPSKINNDNALKNYTDATRMNRYIKLVFVIVFGILAYKTVEPTRLGVWFLPVVLGLLVLALFYFIVLRKKTIPLLIKKSFNQ